MAAPTWRNVAAPDFSTSMQGMRDANNLLSNAFAGLDRTIGKVDANVSERVNNAFQNAILGFQDPEALKAAMGDDPTLGFDARRLDGASRAFAAGRVGQLLGEDLSENQIKTGNLELEMKERRNAQDVAFDDAAPVIAQVQMLRRQGKDQEADALLAQNPDLMRGLSGERALGATKGFFDARRDRVGLANEQLGLDRGQYGFGREQRNDQIGDAALQLVESLRANNLTDTEALADLNGRNVPPEISARARQMLNLPGLMNDGGMGGGSGMSFSGGTAGDASLRVMNYEAAGRGFKAVPENIQTLGQLSDWQSGLNQQGIKSSAMGVYQIVGQTLRSYAPDVIGKDWRNAPLTFEAQDAIGKAIFEDHKGSADALRKQWVSLSRAEAEQLRRLPWEQARQVIAQKESGGDPSSLMSPREEAAIAAGGKIGRGQRQNEVLADPLAMAYAKNMGFSGDDRDVLANLDQDMRFKGASRKEVDTLVRSVMTEAQSMKIPLNYKQAYEVLRTSMRERSLLGQMFGPKLFGNSDYVIDQGTLKENLKSLGGGAAQRAAGALEQVEFSKAEQQAARSQLAQARARLNAAESRGLPPAKIQQYRRELMEASASAEAVGLSQGRQGDYALYPKAR